MGVECVQIFLLDQSGCFVTRKFVKQVSAFLKITIVSSEAVFARDTHTGDPGNSICLHSTLFLIRLPLFVVH